MFTTINLPPDVLDEEEVLSLETDTVVIFNIKNSPQNTVMVDVIKDKISKLFRMTVWKGFLFKVTNKKPIRIIKIIKAYVMTPLFTI